MSIPIKSRPFDSADEAAVDALLGILPKSISDKHEYGGYIFQIGTPRPKYYYTVPLVKSSQPTGGRFRLPNHPQEQSLLPRCIRIPSTRTGMARKVSLVLL